MTGGRLFFAAARDGNFPFARLVVNDHIQTPVVAIAIQGIWAAVLVLPGNFESLLSYFGFSSYMWYGATVATLLCLRVIEKDTPRPFRVHPYPYLPLVFITAAAAIVIASLWQSPTESFIALACVFSAVPYYYLFIQSNRCNAFLWQLVPQWLRLGGKNEKRKRKDAKEEKNAESFLRSEGKNDEIEMAEL